MIPLKRYEELLRWLYDPYFTERIADRGRVAMALSSLRVPLEKQGINVSGADQT